MTKTSKRLRILSDSEIKVLYQRPYFTILEKRHFFNLTGDELKYANDLAIESAIYFVISLGYFKAKHQFFKFLFAEVVDDVNFIMDTYFSDKTFPKQLPSSNTRTSIKFKVLSILEYSNCNNRSMLNKARGLVRYYSEPSVIFRELVDFLEHQKMLLPAYSVLQDSIGCILTEEEERLHKIIRSFLSKDMRSKLKSLIDDNDKFYNLSELKLDLKNFKYKQMTSEIQKQKESVEIYKLAKYCLPKLKISEQNIHYYASLIFYYTPYKLRRMPSEMSALYILCYVYHRYQKINDNITQAFIFLVYKYIASANEFADNKISSERKELEINDNKVGTLLGYYADDTMFDMKFSGVAKKAYDVVPKDQLIKIRKHFTGSEDYRNELKWEYYASKSKAFEMNLRPLFITMNIQSDSNKNIYLTEAIKFLKSNLIKNNSLKNIPSSSFPKKILPPKIAKYIVNDDKTIYPAKYEFYIYDKLSKYIKDHKIYLNDTIQFKSFEEDIKVTKNWETNGEKILQKINKPKLSCNIEDRLKELEEELENSYIEVNQRIESGENKYIKVIENKNGEKSWTLSYPAENDDYVHRYFKNLTPTSISDIFDFVNEICNFTNVITHIKPRDSKSALDEICIKACIIANATRQGSYQMSKKSNLDLQSLINTEHNFIRLDTIKAACDIILKKIITMPAFQNASAQQNIYHGSMDGSKHATKHQTSKARYSPKYFGLEKGVSVLGMILNNVPVNGCVIGANEHESHYLYDLYHGMNLDIDMDVISTDGAGSNQVNFAIFDLADSVQFAPHYKSIKDRVDALYGFKPLSKYKDLLIKPKKISNKKFIIEEWPNVQRILSALFMKETTQHIIVKKLCSHNNQSKTKKALWEYNNILFSIYILRSIDDPILRRSVRIVLNHGEAYNKQYNAIAKVGGKKFRGLSELEMEIWHQCTRLITLVITFYNMYILSELITEYSHKGEDKLAKLIAQISPLATSHIILSGFYNYENDDKRSIDIANLISAFSEIINSNELKRAHQAA